MNALILHILEARVSRQDSYEISRDFLIDAAIQVCRIIVHCNFLMGFSKAARFSR
jgi:hypothetical protein